LNEHPYCRKIAFVGYLDEYLPVPLLPKEFIAVGMKAKRLVKLEIKSDKRHVVPLHEL